MIFTSSGLILDSSWLLVINTLPFLDVVDSLISFVIVIGSSVSSFASVDKAFDSNALMSCSLQRVISTFFLLICVFDTTDLMSIVVGISFSAFDKICFCLCMLKSDM